MQAKFIGSIPQSYAAKPKLVSGIKSKNLRNFQYILVEDNQSIDQIFEIRFLARCSPFNHVIALDGLLAIGHEEFFYLYDLKNEENLIALKLYGYFCHLYIDKEDLYVTDASGIYCISKQGQIKWQNDQLGIDGVVINEIDSSFIYASGELDPPGGWEDYKLNIQTGETLK